MWLTGKLTPDFKTIADFRRDNGGAIRAVCRQLVILCREIGLIAGGTVAVDGSRFKAVNTRDKNYTPGAIRLRMEQVDASIARYLGCSTPPIARRMRWRRCGLAGCLSVWRRYAARCGSFRRWSERSWMRLTIRHVDRSGRTGHGDERGTGMGRLQRAGGSGRQAPSGRRP
jgi:hypothetical protein